MITAEGLATVYRLLRKTTSKSTAVSCFWIRSRSCSELVWLVGNKNRFNAEGYVAVNYTKKQEQHPENDWKYLSAIKALVGLSALLHDWGKASIGFQNKLKSKDKQLQSDTLRHEWISCLLFERFVARYQSDEAWIDALIKGDINENDLQQAIVNNDNEATQKKPLLSYTCRQFGSLLTGESS